jgi:hypothetical protein
MHARKTRDPSPKEQRRNEDGAPLEGVDHVVETWLPPGVSVDEAKDPGSHPQPDPKKRKPTDDRT